MSDEKSIVSLVLNKNDMDTTVSNHIKYAVAWARVSTDMQGERGLSIPAQLSEIQQYAIKNNIKIVKEYFEVASAFHDIKNRPEFLKLLEFIKQQRSISYLLVHDHSRFSRNMSEGSRIQDDLSKLGVNVLSITEPNIDDHSSAGVYIKAITFAKNEAYSRDVAFHTMKGCKANIKTRDPETGWCYKNGGQPLFGYKLFHIDQSNKKEKSIQKSIWLLDDREISGRPLYSWARYCLVEMILKGKSLKEVCEFCEKNNIPAPRKENWRINTWHYLLEPYKILKYCGYEVWNVHEKKGKEKDSSEWIIIENAHPSIISEDEAKLILETRKEVSNLTRFTFGKGQNRVSPYLLSGGIFKCSRCGSNMVGKRASNGSYYYLCGSSAYFRGKGCGRGVWVPKKQLEIEVINGIKNILNILIEPDGLALKINKEIKKYYQNKNDEKKTAENKINTIKEKINNIRKAIEDGYDDIKWANESINKYRTEINQIQSRLCVEQEEPRIDINTVKNLLVKLDDLLANGDLSEIKRFLRLFINEIKIAPEHYEVSINYKVPEQFVQKLVAGVGFEPTTFGL